MLVWPFAEGPYPIVPPFRLLGACDKILTLVVPEYQLVEIVSSMHQLLCRTWYVLIRASFETLPAQSSQDELSIDKVSVLGSIQ